jgi:flagellar hook-associated protein 3 FlgL
MVTRVSTAGNYASVLANLMAAQQRQVDAGNRVSSQKNGNDLKDYAKKAETLTAMRTVERRLTAYQDQNSVIAAKLSTQDNALVQVSDAATATRQAIADALASDRGDTLMQELQAQFQNAVEGMNTRYDGKYLFAGGQIDTKPVSATQLTDLTTGPPIANFFQNDQFKTQAKLDDATTVTTGALASDIGTNMLTGFQTIEAFNQGANGPFNGQLTPAQRTFLQGVLSSWDTIRSGTVAIAAQNGLVQQRVDQVAESLVGQHDTLTVMLGDITDADMAKAATDLTSAQTAVQAAAQVIISLRDTSLLTLLR